MADVQDKGYGDKKLFICTACGKEIMLTKFASQKTCKCDECKEKNAPINPDIVARALAKNPPKERRSADTSSGGATKIRPCIKCGKDTEVSKFMSDQKVMCDACKGVDSSSPKMPKGLAQRLPLDISKLDRSRILPIEEYEVNEICIKNSKLRAVTCPACGHTHMKPNMVVDWSQFGLIISYQCPSCLVTMLLSEQTNHIIKRHSPGVRFDYTGHEIEKVGASGVQQSRYINIIRKLIKQLDENNIKIDDDEIVPFRWKNDKPVPIGFEVPESDRLLLAIKRVIDLLDNSTRQGSEVDMPEGSRYITVSHTLANKLSTELKEALKGD
jgi:hypothetical protein